MKKNIQQINLSGHMPRVSGYGASHPDEPFVREEAVLKRIRI